MLRERSSGSVKIISLDRDELLARLATIATRIRARHPEVREVRLFGSLARGDQTGTSDADLLIVPAIVNVTTGSSATVWKRAISLRANALPPPRGHA